MSEKECLRSCQEVNTGVQMSDKLESMEESITDLKDCLLLSSSNSCVNEDDNCLEGNKLEIPLLASDEHLLKHEAACVTESSVLETVTVDHERGLKRKLDESEISSTDAYLVKKDLPLDDKDEMKVLKEEDVGITEFISDFDGFSGTIKQRYSDFIVNEIDGQGQIVRLSDLSVPTVAENSNNASEVININNLITEENLAKLQNLVESKNKSDEVLLPVDCDKELRGKLHAVIKLNFPDLDSNTVDRNGAKFIQVRIKTKKGSARSNSWKKSTGDYCKFVLYKENKDTLEALNIISKFLRVSSKAFTFAGTKDRRAKTTQEVTAYRIEPSRLCHLNNCLKNIVLGNFSICKQQLKLGDLLGNRFLILLRNVLGSNDEIEKGVTSLRDRGFINYYGMQRFGTTRIATHWVGRALLCGNWSEAIELILKPREGDKPEVSRARDIWWSTKDSKKALQELKSHQCIERKLLEGLSKHGKNDLVAALSWIPYNMRLMYIHAYQSFLWNCVVSRRIREFGFSPVVGDLVCKDPIREEEDDEYTEKLAAVKNKRDLIQPIEVTEQNLSEFCITDVVIPLPGYDISYPNNQVKSWFAELLKKDGMENFSFKNQVRDYSLPGGYRKIIIVPNLVEHEIMYYDDYQVPLIHGDLDVLQDNKLPDRVYEGKFKAVKLELSLPSSSYATMAIREILKSGTSAAYQTMLNVT